MKKNVIALPLLALAGLLTVGFILQSLGVRPTTTSGALHPSSDNSSVEIGSLRDSVQLLRQQVEDMSSHMPGLGEYMGSIQLHMAKLWYAGTAKNWQLMNYEAGEVSEAMENASVSNDTLNLRGVNVHGVLESLQNSVIPQLKQSIDTHNEPSFKNSYLILLSSCNDCHRASDHEYIRITEPKGNPVTNQNWQAP
jgi:hypothetical protein